jgi:BirA family biotin operon repressor/biotin-[acetyl-CoA-carboxylase] ligase
MKFEIRKLETTTSTNDELKRAAAAGAREGLVVWALKQTEGRGRQGRVWETLEGNLLFSLLLRPPTPMRMWSGYSFVAGLAVQEAIDSVFAESPETRGIKVTQLKWPNDVLIDDKKVCGILLEAGTDWVVMGIGLNVKHAPDNPMYPATCLAAEAKNCPPMDKILGKILGSLDEWYCRMNNEGFSPVRAAWLVNARKGTMRVRPMKNRPELLGEFVDLDAEGSLRLRMRDGTESHISAGDVFFLG